jgi:hypothetical protein
MRYISTQQSFKIRRNTSFVSQARSAALSIHKNSKPQASTLLFMWLQVSHITIKDLLYSTRILRSLDHSYTSHVSHASHLYRARRSINNRYRPRRLARSLQLM